MYGNGLKVEGEWSGVKMEGLERRWRVWREGESGGGRVSRVKVDRLE